MAGEQCRQAFCHAVTRVLSASNGRRSCMIPTTYLLPIKSDSLVGLDELTAYLRYLKADEVLVVDGSEPDIFDEHARRWAFLRHVSPDPTIGGLNGKARGVLSGLAIAKHDRVVIADDDVRYDNASLERVAGLLEHAAVVRPQNYFEPQVWHTLLDTSRSLINRVTGGDWPGTLGVRASALPAGYNADVLFENLEMVRTVKACGGEETIAYDVFVSRVPPTTKHFAAQRVRQAYDEFARPLRLGISLAILPAAAMLCAKRNFRALAAAAVGIVMVAELGRRKSGGGKYFPLVASLISPLWVVERAVCSWLALGTFFLRGGVRYGGGIVRYAATPNRPERTL
jgi:hypothetical protein